MADIDFKIEIADFHKGLSPLAHVDSQTFIGDRGQASEMLADVIGTPGFLGQSPGSLDLTNGNESGVVDQLIRFILDKPTATGITFAVGTTKLFKIENYYTVKNGGTPSWPQTITNMAEGESIVRLGNNLFVFYNTESAGEIAAMPLDTEAIDPDWGSTTDQALEKAPHPAAVHEIEKGILVFGNGQYLGVYIEEDAILDVQKLNFGDGNEVVDVVFHANVWWIAVNNVAGRESRIYIYDGSILSNVLSDEVGVGAQKIGFLYVLNGIVYVAYVSDDLAATIFAIGWISGRQLKPLRYFKGSLPDHRQKTLYKNTILFYSGGYLWDCGAPVEQLPIQISRLRLGGYNLVGGIGAPFDLPMIASSNGSTSHRLARFGGLETACNWKSILIDLTEGRILGKITDVIVQTKALGASARADITLEGNQGAKSATALQISGTNKTRHVFRSIDLGPVEDVRVVVDWTNGNTTNNCLIRKITLLGVFVER